MCVFVHLNDMDAYIFSDFIHSFFVIAKQQQQQHERFQYVEKKY